MFGCSAVLLGLCAATCLTTAFANEFWILTFNSSNVDPLEMGSSAQTAFSLHTNASWANKDLKVQVTSSDEDVAQANQTFFDLPKSNNLPLLNKSFIFNLTSEFIGYAKLSFRVVELGKLNKILAVFYTTVV